MKLPPGHRFIHFERIDSTNAEARRLAASGERGPLWILADEQTQGRGRLGRVWQSEPGNLHVTLLFQTGANSAVLGQLAIAAALAVHEVVRHLVSGAKVSLKWPNDVLIDGAKVSGVLAESLGCAVVLLGCGVNLASAPTITRYPVTCLARHASSPSREELLEMLADSLWRWLGLWDEGGGFAEMRRAWLTHCSGLGRTMTVLTGGEATTGVFRGIAEDGALLLELPGGARKALHAGDVIAPTREPQ